MFTFSEWTELTDPYGKLVSHEEMHIQHVQNVMTVAQTGDMLVQILNWGK
jgi:phosphoribulokinase